MKNKILMLALSILVGGFLSDTLSAQTNCDCEFIETMITQDASTQDTAVFYLSLHNRADTSCFESVVVVVDTGYLFNWTVLSPSWSIVQIDVQTLRLNHTSGKIPSGISVPLQLTVSSDFDKYVFTTQTTYADPILQGTFCAHSFSLTDEQSVLKDCCPPDLSIAGHEMVVNGSFNAGNTGFQTDYVYWYPNFNIPPGGYSIHNATTLYNANDEWFCVGRRGTPDDLFMAVDCAPGLTELAAWRQSFSLDKDSTYVFCGYFNNLLLPQLPFSDPTVELWLIRPDSSKTRLFFYTLEETPDQWIKLESTIQVPEDGNYQLEIWCLGGLNNGFDFAMDELTFRTCRPSFICDISPSIVVEQIGCNQINLFPATTGQAPFSYQWSDGSTEQDRVLFLNCGNYTYCLTVTDANGCEADTCLSFSIIDDGLPTISCPALDTLQLPSDRCFFTPTELPAGTVEDNCSPNAEILWSLLVNGVPQTILPDDEFPPGDYMLLATPIDFCNNVGQPCSFLLTISSLDTIKPLLECPWSDAYAGETNSDGLCTRLFDFSNLIANDLCGIAEQTWSVSGSTIGQGTGAPGLLTLQEGTSFLTVTAKDFAGNTFSCNAELTVSCEICTCGGLSNLQYSNPVSGNWESFTCIADTLKANCLVGETWSVTGTVACSGEDCIDTDVPVYWELYRLSQSLVASGIATANPNFIIDIPSTTFDQLGYYFLVVRMKCGGDWCNCGAYIRSSCGEIICDNN
ncbi:MAG TPA: hypothetical protein DCF33_21675, partial [Saprospirales bacterium]|nr:hypothetical protein [Saprospirales bacterium]